MNPIQTVVSAYLLVSGRNDSLSPSGRCLFFGSIVVVSLAIASFWALNGAWYVLPFAVVEMAVLYGAMTLIERHAGDFESIRLCGDSVLVEQRRRGCLSRHDFNRYWVQLVVSDAGGGRLVMRSHGREVAFGELFSQDQRLAVASELRRFMKSY